MPISNVSENLAISQKLCQTFGVHHIGRCKARLLKASKRLINADLSRGNWNIVNRKRTPVQQP